MDHVELLEGSRVTLLVPGSARRIRRDRLARSVADQAD